MPYIDDDAMKTLDLFMTSIGRKGADKANPDDVDDWFGETGG